MTTKLVVERFAALSPQRLRPQLAALATLATLATLAGSLQAAGNEVGATAATRAIYTIGGNDFTSTLGEPISEELANGANSPYVYWIEVPPNTPNLIIDLFDPNIDTDTAAQALDFLQGTATTTANYRLYNPNGTQNGTTLVGNGAGPAGGDNAWLNFRNIANPTAGHWRFEVDQTDAVNGAATADDINGWGIRAYATAGAPTSTADVELNIYYHSFTNYGIYAAGTTTTRTWEDYPFVTSDCTAVGDNFDADDTAGSNNSFRFRAFGGFYDSTALQAGAGTNIWDRDTYTDFARFPASPALFEAFSRGYGIGTLNVAVTNAVAAGGGNGANFVPFKMGNSNAIDYAPNVNLPDINPQPNTFRVYLPTDGGVAPLKPRMTQRVAGVDSTPLNVGQPKVHYVEVTFTNPTPHSVTFSATNTLRANVPGGAVVFAGGQTISQGSFTSVPSIGGSGNVVANPGTVAANTTVTMGYLITVTPPDALLLNVTGTVALNGTAATYVDETGNTTQSQATYSYGPLCPVAVRVGVGLAAEMGTMLATTNSDGTVTVAWETVAELDCAGFHVVGGGERLNAALIPATGSTGSAALYSFVDNLPWSADETERVYLIEEIDLSGASTLHGPVTTGRPAATSAVAGWTRY